MCTKCSCSADKETDLDIVCNFALVHQNPFEYNLVAYYHTGSLVIIEGTYYLQPCIISRHTCSRLFIEGFYVFDCRTYCSCFGGHFLLHLLGLHFSLFFEDDNLVCFCLLRCPVDVPAGHDLPNYYGRDDGRGAPRVMKEADSLGASYDRYLRGVVHMIFSLNL